VAPGVGVCVRILLIGVVCAAGLCGQSRIQESATGAVLLNQNDLSVLEGGEKRRDIACKVTPRRAEMGFDLRLRSGYDVELTLEGSGPVSPELMVIARVRPVGSEGKELHLYQRLRVPIPEGGIRQESFTGGFSGAFLVGEGKYAVDWLLRDPAGRYCADFWEFEAKAPLRVKAEELELAPVPDPFMDEPAVKTADGVAVKVLVNYEPQRQEELLGMVRAIARDPRVGPVSLAVFNLEQRKVLVKQERVEFPKLKEALEGFQTGLVDAKVLSGADGGVERFLAELVDAPELGTAETVVFLGPPSGVDERLGTEWRTGNGGPGPARMFYLRYQPNPWQTAWTDSIERAVQSVQGKRFAIQQPKDLVAAWGEIMQGWRASIR